MKIEEYPLINGIGKATISDKTNYVCGQWPRMHY